MNRRQYQRRLNADQIYSEIERRYRRVANKTTGNMYVFYGEDWDFLDEYARSEAEEWFLEDIQDKKLRGIIYLLTEGRNRDYVRDGNDNILYTRIPNDLR